MPRTPFVGRVESTEGLQRVLLGREKGDGNLVIQSIEGPGGIGKTCLLDKVLDTCPLTDRGYLTLRVNGTISELPGLVFYLEQLISSSTGSLGNDKPPTASFPNTQKVILAFDTLKALAVKEYRQMEGNEYSDDELSIIINAAIDLGGSFNQVFPKTKKFADFDKAPDMIRKAMKLKELIPILSRSENPGLWYRFWNGAEITLMDEVRKDAPETFAKALFFDLHNLIGRWRNVPTQGKDLPLRKGIDRLLLIVDDFEHLHHNIDDFLIRCFLPKLLRGQFQSVVIILGRDQLAYTNPGWDQNLKATQALPIRMKPLSREDTDSLAEACGLGSPEEKARLWHETKGYPYYIQLFLEEIESGGQSAAMLGRVWDRHTRWMSEKGKEWLKATLFLEMVNKRTLRAMLGSPEEADEAFSWFREEGSIRDTSSPHYTVREYLRARLQAYLRISDPDLFERLQQKANALGAS